MLHLHALTPGDHFSPRTGSAVATVVHGLAQHTSPRPCVLVAEGTYPERYPSADVIEYPLSRSAFDRTRRAKAADVLRARIGAARVGDRQLHHQLVAHQDQWPPCVVMAHNMPALVPMIAAQHRPVLYAHNELLRTYTRREAEQILAHADRIIAVSNFTADGIAARAPRIAHKVRVVPNGVDPEVYSLPRRPREGPLRVGFVGRVIPSKGVHLLVRAAMRLNRPDISLTVRGSQGFAADDPLSRYELRLRRLAHKLPGEVRFVAFRPPGLLPAIYSGLDVVVVPSLINEAFGLTVLEAMAAGAAVIATDSGGLPEAAGGAATLIARGDVDMLAQALAWFADDPAACAEQGRAGRSRAARQTWARSAHELQRALD